MLRVPGIVQHPLNSFSQYFIRSISIASLFQPILEAKVGQIRRLPASCLKSTRFLFP